MQVIRFLPICLASFVSNSSPNPISTSETPSTLPLIAINTTSQHPFKLIASNYLSWRTQFTELLIGYDLLGFIDGTLPCPPQTMPITSSSTTPPTVSPTYLHWYRQNKLLPNAIFSSVSKNVMLLVAMGDTSRETWSIINCLFTNHSRTQVM